jgi:sulfur-oxidizing protein SoxY
MQADIATLPKHHTQRTHRTHRRRRTLLVAALASVALRPALATPTTMQSVITAWSGGGSIRDGRVKLDVPQLVDNGNLVSITVQVESPMSAADHVKEIAIFNDGNPLPEVSRFELSPRNGRAEVAIGIRLATTQHLVAIARLSDGSLWQLRAEVVVVLAACIE